MQNGSHPTRYVSVAERVLGIVALAVFLGCETLVSMLACQLIGSVGTKMSVRTKNVVRNENKGNNSKNELHAGGACRREIARSWGYVMRFVFLRRLLTYLPTAGATQITQDGSWPKRSSCWCIPFASVSHIQICSYMCHNSPSGQYNMLVFCVCSSSNKAHFPRKS